MNTIEAFLGEEEPMQGDVGDLFAGALLGGRSEMRFRGFCEGWSRERLLEVSDLTRRYRERGERLVGAYTDDTQQTLVVVESILACGGVDPENIAGRFLEMWRRGALSGYGAAFRQTLERLDGGTPWGEAASADLPSNGAVMKVGPVGLWHWQWGEKIWEDALALCHVTHRDSRAVAGAHVVGHLLIAPAADGAGALSAHLMDGLLERGRIRELGGRCI